MDLLGPIRCINHVDSRGNWECWNAVVNICLPVGTPAVIAPFQYSLLLLAGAWGYLFYEEIPNFQSFVGMGLIVSSSLFIFFREMVRKKPVAVKTSLRT